MTTSITSYGNVYGYQLISTITSAAPLVVSNTNLVSNLNTQYFNNQLSSYYTNASNISSGLLGVSYGGTGVSNMTTGNLHFGSNGILGQSPSLFWNSTSNFLGVNNSNPMAVLDVISPASNTCNAIIRGGLYRQLQIVPGTNIAASNQQSEIIFNYYSDYTNLGYACGIGMNTAACGYCNLGITAPGKGLAMTLQSNTGYVGISTSNPAYNLDVNGIINTNTSLYTPQLYQTNSINAYFMLSSNYVSSTNGDQAIPTSNFVFMSNISKLPSTVAASNLLSSSVLTIPFNGIYSLSLGVRIQTYTGALGLYFSNKSGSYASNSTYNNGRWGYTQQYYSNADANVISQFSGYMQSNDSFQLTVFLPTSNTLYSTYGGTYLAVNLLYRC